MVFSQNIQTHALNIQTHWISASNGTLKIESRVIEGGNKMKGRTDFEYILLFLI